MSIIQLKNVSYRYPLDAEPTIKKLSMNIEAGKVYGMIGANQSGKTTICNMIRGFIPAMFFGEVSGEVLYKNKSIQEYNIGALAADIGYSSQNPFTQISGVKETVEEELAYGMENIGVPLPQMKARISELTELFHLEKILKKNPYELSGGQMQRVALASIVALDPGVIILDEPTSQLDPQSTEEIFNIVSMLKKQGKTIILVEHKVDLLAEFCDDILLISGGKLVESGSAHQVLSDPKILKYGGDLPQVATFFLQQLHATGEIPITLSEAIERLKGGEAR